MDRFDAVAMTSCVALCVSAFFACAPVPAVSRIREVSGSDPISGVLSNCADLFSSEDNPRKCQFVEDRGSAGADVVRERISCVQSHEYVDCKGRPGEARARRNTG
jgi:hypothetical protein